MRLDWFRLSLAACVAAVLVHSWLGLLAGAILSLALQNFRPLSGASLIRQTQVSVLLTLCMFGLFYLAVPIAGVLSPAARVVFADMFALAFISIPSLLLVSMMRISPEMRARIRRRRD